VNSKRTHKSYIVWIIPCHVTALLAQKNREAELLFRRVGITFNVYGEEEVGERLMP
jgi:uncharacterized circularly permuted ATP-grasp superfamily protein